MAEASRVHLITALTAGVVFIAACGGSTDTKKDTAPATAAPAHGATEIQINAQPRNQVQDGGKLVWPIDSMPVNFNYHQIDGTERNHVYIYYALMPGAFMADGNGTPHWNPNLLASDPILVTEPKQVVTYRINPKAAWYDGTPITWEDFFWQWKALNGTNKAYEISSANGYEMIESVARGADDREVVATYKTRYSDWQSLFFPIYPASTNKSPQIFNTGWKSKPLTSAGPFRFDHIDETAKTVTLVRSDKWWGPPAKLDSIVYRALDIDAQTDALANGEVDLMDIGPDANKYNRAKGITTAEIRAAGGPNFRHITINGSGPILKDSAVRQAIAMAINRGAMARAMLSPLGIEPKTLDNHIFMANQAGYQNNAGEVGKYDPEKARQLLDQAGWTLDGAVRKKGGQPLELTIVIPSGIAISRQESELVQNMLGQIGVTLKIDTVPSPDFFAKYVTPGQFDLTLFSWMGTPYPIGSARSIYAKPKPGPGGALSIEQNYARTGSDEIDQLYAQATAELDRRKAIDIANRIDTLIWQEVHSLTLYQRPDLWAVKKKLANIGAFGLADIVYQDIGWMKQ